MRALLLLTLPLLSACSMLGVGRGEPVTCDPLCEVVVSNIGQVQLEVAAGEARGFVEPGGTITLNVPTAPRSVGVSYEDTNGRRGRGRCERVGVGPNTIRFNCGHMLTSRARAAGDPLQIPPGTKPGDPTGPPTRIPPPPPDTVPQ